MKKEIERKSNRVYFPLQLRKDGKPKKRQEPVGLSFNDRAIMVKRGIITTLSIDYLRLVNNSGIECFISNGYSEDINLPDLNKIGWHILKDIRCDKCGKLLAKAVNPSKVDIKCHLLNCNGKGV